MSKSEKSLKKSGKSRKRKPEEDKGGSEKTEPSKEPSDDDVRKPTEEELLESQKPENQLDVETVRGKKRKLTEKSAEQSKERLRNLERESAIDYLKKWKHDKARWKFEKLKQIFIQSNALDEEKFDKDMWPIVLEYLEKSKGASRKFLVGTAEKVIQEVDKAIEEDTQRADLLRGSRYLRAREVLQILN